MRGWNGVTAAFAGESALSPESVSYTHLKAKEMLGMRLCVLHNLYFYNTMMEEIRDAIEQHRYAEYKAVSYTHLDVYKRQG